MSTGNVGWPPAIAKTTSAVFGPTPGNAMSAVRAASVGSSRIGSTRPFPLSKIDVAIRRIRGAFCRERPACQIAAAIASSRAAARRAGVISPNVVRNPSRPRRSFATVVLWDRTVDTRTSNAGMPLDQSFIG